jgi:Sec-independent protein translocase protein TatA
MSEDAITLALLGRLIRDMQADMRAFRTEMAEFRDQMTVHTAILLRLEAGQNTMAEQLRTLTSQHQRTNDRLRALEEAAQR